MVENMEWVSQGSAERESRPAQRKCQGEELAPELEDGR